MALPIIMTRGNIARAFAATRMRPVAGPRPGGTLRGRAGPFSIQILRDVRAWRNLVLQLRAAAKVYVPAETDLAMVAVARYMNGRVRAGIRTSAPGGFPLKANAPATIQKKGGNRPLFDSGATQRSIVHSVTRVGRTVTAAIGPAAHATHSDSRRTVARVAAFHEFGFRSAPEGEGPFLRRRFLLPVLIRERPFIIRMFAKEFSAGMARKLSFFHVTPNLSGGIFRD